VLRSGSRQHRRLLLGAHGTKTVGSAGGRSNEGDGPARPCRTALRVEQAARVILPWTRPAAAPCVGTGRPPPNRPRDLPQAGAAPRAAEESHRERQRLRPRHLGASSATSKMATSRSITMPPIAVYAGSRSVGRAAFLRQRHWWPAALLTSLVPTAACLLVDPFPYLRDVFDRIGAHPIHRFADLSPERARRPILPSQADTPGVRHSPSLNPASPAARLRAHLPVKTRREE